MKDTFWYEMILTKYRIHRKENILAFYIPSDQLTKYQLTKYSLTDTIVEIVILIA